MGKGGISGGQEGRWWARYQGWSLVSGKQRGLGPGREEKEAGIGGRKSSMQGDRKEGVSV
jgi:hypothetical protein